MVRVRPWFFFLLQLPLLLLTTTTTTTTTLTELEEEVGGWRHELDVDVGLCIVDPHAPHCRRPAFSDGAAERDLDTAVLAHGADLVRGRVRGRVRVRVRVRG